VSHYDPAQMLSLIPFAPVIYVELCGLHTVSLTPA
jgi:hypothetical protein